jgi:hypothetical protein
MLSETENTEIGSSMCLSPLTIIFLFLIKREPLLQREDVVGVRPR